MNECKYFDSIDFFYSEVELFFFFIYKMYVFLKKKDIIYMYVFVKMKWIFFDKLYWERYLRFIIKMVKIIYFVF